MHGGFVTSLISTSFGPHHSVFLQFPKLYYRCELAAIEAGEKERALMYRKKSLDVAGDDDNDHICLILRYDLR